MFPSPLPAASVQCWGETVLKSSDFSGNRYLTVAAAENHSLAVRPDGSVIAWGRDDADQATAPCGNNVIAVAGGYQHSIALKSDGSIIAWGNNSLGQLSPPSGNDFIKIASGANHCLALKPDGSIVGWGWNSAGQATPPSGNNYIAISAGYQYSLALKSDGSIVGWGDNYYGQAAPPDGNDFIAISAGGYHSLALKSDGSIVAWGWNNYGQATSPVGNNFIAIAAGEFHSLAVKSDGSIVAWGSNSYNKATPPVGNDFVAVFAGGNHSLALRSNGDFAGWGGNDYGQSMPPRGNNFVKISTSKGTSLALGSDGSIAAWGNNQYGQATQPDGNNFIDIAAGWYHSVAIKSDSSLTAWGRNDYSQATPPSIYGCVSVAAGAYHSVALRYNGYIACWGRNDYLQSLRPNGQYIAITAGGNHSLAITPVHTVVGWGLNDGGQSNSPDGRDFIAVAAGDWHSLALRSNASVAGWGWNGNGQAYPPAGNNFVAVAATLAHSLVLKSDGSIVGWGFDERGETLSPPGNNFMSIAAGERHSLALYNPQPGELNGDGFINFIDFAKFADQWLQPPDPCDPNSGNFTNDGDIDLFDFAQLSSNWLNCFVTNSRVPLPIDRDVNVGIGIALHWAQGLHAASHNVYFGTDFNEVNNADISDSNVFMGNQTSVSWDVNNYDINGLDYNNTYYWRVDEVAGCTVRGNVWSFSTAPPPPGQAANPMPPDGTNDVNLMPDLSWTAGTGATSHVIYFGKTNPPPFRTNRTNTVFNPGLLDTNTIYYWRIDEKNIGGIITEGNVWSFKTFFQLPAQAVNLTPANGVTDINSTTYITWTPGSMVTSHDLYFGTANPPPFKINLTDTTYNTGLMDFNTTYYWRVDERNGSGATTGITWSFKTVDPLASWWKFDEGTGTIAHDSRGSYNGTIYGGAAWTTDGALSFDGANDYVICGGRPGGYFSVSVWMKTSANGVLVSDRYDGNVFGSWYTLSSTGLEIGDNGQGRYMNVTFIKSALDNAWHHIVYSYAGIYHAIYIDGSLDQQFTYSTSMNQSNPLFIGKRGGTTDNYGWFNGMIEDVRFYNKALTSDEVALLYQQSR